MHGSSCPVVARLQGPWFLNGIANGFKRNDEFNARVRAEGEAIVNAHSLSSPSQFVLRAVQEHYHVKPSFSTVIPYAVEPVASSRVWDPKTADPDHVLFVGRFDRHKGADICIRAFAKVLEKRPNARLTLVGPDRGLIDETTGRVRTAEEWLNDDIQPSQLRSRDLPARANVACRHSFACDRDAAVTLVPSRFENFPNTVLEAMAQGCPVVASRVGGIPEIIEHERNGLLCAVEDANDLAAKILCLLNNPTFAANLGNTALQDSLVRFSPMVVARQTLEFYEEVCSRWRAGVSASPSKGSRLEPNEHVTA